VCLYRISRFPYISSFPTISSQIKWEAWEAQKEVYMKAASKWESPVKEILIPFTGREGQDRESSPVYIRVPKLERGGKVPVVILMTGLDGYRPDNTERTSEFLSRGWGVVIVKIPGTADCPADPSDPKSCDRLRSCILDWMENERGYGFDMSRVMVWGFSTGGYHALRIAHTHKERLKGVVAQGAGFYEFFGQEWIEKAERHEYPFSYVHFPVFESWERH
jgi:predicted dienelactone hydrolase